MTEGTPVSCQAVLSELTDQPWYIHGPKLGAMAARVEQGIQNGAMFVIRAPRQRTAYELQRGGIAVIPLEGPLMPNMNALLWLEGGTATQEFAAAVRQAASDPKVTAIVLDVDSPGGTAVGTQEASEAVREAAEKKPTVAVVNGGHMASSAYYIAAAAMSIVASPSSYVGSIGSYSLHYETSKLADRIGIKFTFIKAGKYKTDGNVYEPLSDQARQSIQERVDDAYRQFVEAVATYRGITVEKVIADYGQGKYYIATRAHALGLVDHVGTLEQVIADLSRGDAGGPRSQFALRQEEVRSMACLPFHVEEGLVEGKLRDREFKRVVGPASPDDEAALRAEFEHGGGEEGLRCTFEEYKAAASPLHLRNHVSWSRQPGPPQPKGRTVSEEEFAALHIRRNAFQGDWRYEIHPQKKSHKSGS
jgi:signal peptide peptidase SppA